MEDDTLQTIQTSTIHTNMKLKPAFRDDKLVISRVDIDGPEQAKSQRLIDQFRQLVNNHSLSGLVKSQLAQTSEAETEIVSIGLKFVTKMYLKIIEDVCGPIDESNEYVTKVFQTGESWPTEVVEILESTEVFSAAILDSLKGALTFTKLDQIVCLISDTHSEAIFLAVAFSVLREVKQTRSLLIVVENELIVETYKKMISIFEKLLAARGLEISMLHSKDVVEISQNANINLKICFIRPQDLKLISRYQFISDKTQLEIIIHKPSRSLVPKVHEFLEKVREIQGSIPISVLLVAPGEPQLEGTRLPAYVAEILSANQYLPKLNSVGHIHVDQALSLNAYTTIKSTWDHQILHVEIPMTLGPLKKGFSEQILKECLLTLQKEQNSLIVFCFDEYESIFSSASLKSLSEILTPEFDIKMEKHNHSGPLLTFGLENSQGDLLKISLIQASQYQEGLLDDISANTLIFLEPQAISPQLSTGLKNLLRFSAQNLLFACSRKIQWFQEATILCNLLGAVSFVKQATEGLYGEEKSPSRSRTLGILKTHQLERLNLEQIDSYIELANLRKEETQNLKQSIDVQSESQDGKVVELSCTVVQSNSSPVSPLVQQQMQQASKLQPTNQNQNTQTTNLMSLVLKSHIQPEGNLEVSRPPFEIFQYRNRGLTQKAIDLEIEPPVLGELPQMQSSIQPSPLRSPIPTDNEIKESRPKLLLEVDDLFSVLTLLSPDIDILDQYMHRVAHNSLDQEHVLHCLRKARVDCGEAVHSQSKQRAITVAFFSCTYIFMHFLDLNFAIQFRQCSMQSIRAFQLQLGQGRGQRTLPPTLRDGPFSEGLLAPGFVKPVRLLQSDYISKALIGAAHEELLMGICLLTVTSLFMSTKRLLIVCNEDCHIEEFRALISRASRNTPFDMKILIKVIAFIDLQEMKDIEKDLSSASNFDGHRLVIYLLKHSQTRLWTTTSTQFPPCAVILYRVKRLAASAFVNTLLAISPKIVIAELLNVSSSSQCPPHRKKLGVLYPAACGIGNDTTTRLLLHMAVFNFGKMGILTPRMLSRADLFATTIKQPADKPISDMEQIVESVRFFCEKFDCHRVIVFGGPSKSLQELGAGLATISNKSVYVVDKPSLVRQQKYPKLLDTGAHSKLSHTIVVSDSQNISLSLHTIPADLVVFVGIDRLDGMLLEYMRSATLVLDFKLLVTQTNDEKSMLELFRQLRMSNHAIRRVATVATNESFSGTNTRAENLCADWCSRLASVFSNPGLGMPEDDYPEFKPIFKSLQQTDGPRISCLGGNYLTKPNYGENLKLVLPTWLGKVGELYTPKYWTPLRVWEWGESKGKVRPDPRVSVAFQPDAIKNDQHAEFSQMETPPIFSTIRDPRKIVNLIEQAEPRIEYNRPFGQQPEAARKRAMPSSSRNRGYSRDSSSDSGKESPPLIVLPASTSTRKLSLFKSLMSDPEFGGKIAKKIMATTRPKGNLQFTSDDHRIGKRHFLHN